jgi:acyl carrier protein
MIPSYFIKLDRFPLTPNGKIDKKALPDVEFAAEDDHVAPESDVEKQLAEIWAEVLNVDKEVIGRDSKFFELGGHSLKVTVLIARIHKFFKVEVPIVKIFETQTLKELSEYIEMAEIGMYISIEPVEKREYYALSSAQKRLYVLQKMAPESIYYNIPFVLNPGADIDKKKMEITFNKLIRRHENFRASFRAVDNEPVQVINNNDVDFKLDVYDGAAGEEVQAIIDNYIKPFDLSKAPFIRAAIVNIIDKGILLILDMHHIISDGLSHEIFEREFIGRYKGETLPELRLQYKDYSVWQNSEEQKQAIKKQEEYWLNVLTGDLPKLNLEMDFKREAVPSFSGEIVKIEFDKVKTVELKMMAKDEDCTLFMIYLAALYILFAKYSGQEDIIIGIPVSGRRHADLEEIIGFFVNMLAVRNYPSGEKTFKEFLVELRGRTLEAFENQEYQFEDLVEKVLKSRDPGRNPLFNVVFTYDSFEAVSQGESEPYRYKGSTTKYDLILGLLESETLCFHFEYNKKLFKKERVEEMAEDFNKILNIILNDKNVFIKDIILDKSAESSKNVYANVELNF